MEGEYRHVFCGPHETSGTECPNCHKPMPRLLALDIKDPRLCLTGSPFEFLPIFFCFYCDLCTDDFSYQILANNEIRLLEYAVNEEERPVYGWGQEEDWEQPSFYPGTSVVLRPLTHEEQSYYQIEYQGETEEQEQEAGISQEMFIDLYRISHQIGGIPFLPQGHVPTVCPICGMALPFLLSLSDECLIERGFTGEDIQLLAYYCTDCHVVVMHQLSWC